MKMVGEECGVVGGVGVGGNVYCSVECEMEWVVTSGGDIY